MKMSDVFELPVSDQDVGCIVLPCMAEDSSFHDAHVVHAVNMHDALINAVDVLLNHPELADYDAIAGLLTRAKEG